MSKKLIFALLIVMVLVSCAAVSAFAATEILNIGPEAGIRAQFVTNSTDTRALELAAIVDGVDGYYTIYSDVRKYYPENEMLWLTLADSISVKASAYKNVIAEIQFNVWDNASDVLPTDSEFKLYVSVDGGVTYSTDSATIKIENTGKMVIVGAGGGPLYKATSSNLLDLVKAGDTITNIKISPRGGTDIATAAHKGAFRLVGVKLIGDADATVAPAATTAAPAATTAAPAATTAAPAATTKAPAATTKAPAATTKAPAATTKAPAATTKAPITAAQTADIGIVVSLGLLLVAGTTVVTLRKKSR